MKKIIRFLFVLVILFSLVFVTACSCNKKNNNNNNDSGNNSGNNGQVETEPTVADLKAAFAYRENASIKVVNDMNGYKAQAEMKINASYENGEIVDFKVAITGETESYLVLHDKIHLIITKVDDEYYYSDLPTETLIESFEGNFADFELFEDNFDALKYDKEKNAFVGSFTTEIDAVDCNVSLFAEIKEDKSVYIKAEIDELNQVSELTISNIGKTVVEIPDYSDFYETFDEAKYLKIKNLLKFSISNVSNLSASLNLHKDGKEDYNQLFKMDFENDVFVTNFDSENKYPEAEDVYYFMFNNQAATLEEISDELVLRYISNDEVESIDDLYKKPATIVSDFDYDDFTVISYDYFTNSLEGEILNYEYEDSKYERLYFSIVDGKLVKIVSVDGNNQSLTYGLESTMEFFDFEETEIKLPEFDPEVFYFSPKLASIINENMNEFDAVMEGTVDDIAYKQIIQVRDEIDYILSYSRLTGNGKTEIKYYAETKTAEHEFTYNDITGKYDYKLKNEHFFYDEYIDSIKNMVSDLAKSPLSEDKLLSYNVEEKCFILDYAETILKIRINNDAIVSMFVATSEMAYETTFSYQSTIDIDLPLEVSAKLAGVLE